VTGGPDRDPSLRAKVAVALATIYVVWGSTYLAIRWTVHELPPFLAGASRFTVAGLGFLLAARLQGRITATRRQVASAALIGALMPGLSNGLVGLAERQVPSGLTALVLALLPLWIALFQVLGPRRVRPGTRGTIGLVVGFAGTALLVWSGPGGVPVHASGLAMLIAASLLWATGSLLASRDNRLQPWMASSGVEMLAGGAVQGVLGLAHGELPRLLEAHPSSRAIGSLVYLAVVGGWGGYGAFSWLARHARPTLVATYSYVNPLVAVLLGWALAGEPLGPRTLLAGAVIVCSVVLVTTSRAVRR
jgi:drug/metabolite transporter (DMT)-like permease